MVYAAVSAINGVGMQSDWMYSNGIRIDTTPPLPLSKFQSNINIVGNPSFEFDIDGSWVLANDQYEMRSDIPYDGVQYLCLNGNEITQTIQTQIGINYRLSFATKRQMPTHDTLRPVATCYVKAGTTEELFVLADKSNQNESFHEEWVYHNLYVNAFQEETDLIFGTDENDIEICFDNIMVQEISSENLLDNQTGIIHVMLKTSPESTEIVASWNVEDYESFITETLVALGTVQGIFLFFLNKTVIILLKTTFVNTRFPLCITSNH